MNKSRVTKLDKRSNTLYMHQVVYILKVININHTVVTYEYFSLQRWDKDHCIQSELAILMMCRFLQIGKG